MRVAEDGKSLIEEPLDECQTQARRLVHKWLEENPGKIAIVGQEPFDCLYRRIAFAIWKAKGRPMSPIPLPRKM